MSNTYEVTGMIKEINETQSFPSGFQKRSFIVTDDDPKYPQDIPLEFVKDGCARLDSFTTGDRVTVEFNLRGNEHNGRHYLTLAAWKIERDGGGAQSPQPTADAARRSANQNGAPPPSSTATADSLDEEDIPF